MALSDERLDAIRQADSGALNFVTLRQFRAIARVIEAEVRKDDEALIRQLRDALGSAEPSGKVKNAWVLHEKAIDAANARLLDSDLSKLTERGAKAWAGVDPQKLREGGAL